MGRQVVRLVVALVMVTTLLVAGETDPSPVGASCAAPSTLANGTIAPGQGECDDMVEDGGVSPAPGLVVAGIFAVLVTAGALAAVSERRARGD